MRDELVAQAADALQRGHGADAANLLVRALKEPGLRRDEQMQLRAALAEAWLLQDDLRRATEALGRPPADGERLDPARLCELWRLHGRLAVARGEPSRGIAFLTRALRQAERAHDSRAIGLAHYELGLCYRHVGDTAIVREHIAQAASALHAAGDRRHLAMVHSLSGVTLAQEGRLDEAMAALRQAERLAVSVHAGDVVATICGNQANVAMMQHRHDQALALAERSVELQEQAGTPHGLGVALASLGQICVQLGNLERAEQVLNRALDVRSPLEFMRETTGAVFDTLAQIYLIRGNDAEASRCLTRSRDAYGDRETPSTRWYQWSVRALEARVALRRGDPAQALAIAADIARAEGVPAAYAQQAELIGVEALLASGHRDEAEERLASVGAALQAAGVTSIWGEFLRLRGRVQAAAGRTTEAYHDFGQSVSVFDLLGERHQAALGYLELGRLAGAAGARSRATRYLTDARAIFGSLGALPDLAATEAVLESIPAIATGEFVGVQMHGDDALVRRIVDAAVTPALLAREATTALLESCDAQAAVIFLVSPQGDVRVVSCAGCPPDAARTLAVAATRSPTRAPAAMLAVAPIGRAAAGARYAAVSAVRPFASTALQRFRTLVAVIRQGFELCSARERPFEPAAGAPERSLEPLIPGFVCASALMQRVTDQIQRLQGNDLTVLITGESGTGKDLVARAIHAGSTRRRAMFLPYNCTSATRELADSQLFGHRRGSFTGAVADQPGVLRTAVGGTLFLDEVGDLPLDVQPKLLRFLEQGEVLPVGETRPLRVDVRVVAATNADLEQRVSGGLFREDLFYRLSVIRIHVPPLRERREEIPHLSTFFLREASERLGKPGVRLSPETLDLFDGFAWPGNVRQLRNEVQRAVALAPDGHTISPEMLSPVFTREPAVEGEARAPRTRRETLAKAVQRIEREMIETALTRTAGNISETARTLGLTRRGLYLKMGRLGIASVRS
ncbi:MAG TPA: sigma 54-interacting transcriptional regulator [Vicinamibacterales bacterium]|nr:sigma 54-interacting transcriptional regulator [Vicinamibacterales bacterium]